MKNLGKKRVFERMTVDAYMGCYVNCSCNCICNCNCQCSCFWSSLSFALSNVYNLSTSINANSGTSSNPVTTNKNNWGIINSHYVLGR